MTDEQLTPEQIAELQKKNCPFCKIVKKEIEAKTIYEDDKVIAIMDISPAVKGHVLVMPKEHYYILPLIPQDVFEHLFNITKQLISAMKKAMIVQRVVMFIASGYAAGQQGSHTLLHLIPREEGDGLDMLDVNENNEDQTDIIPEVQKNIPIVLKQYFMKNNPSVLLEYSKPNEQKNIQKPPPDIDRKTDESKTSQTEKSRIVNDEKSADLDAIYVTDIKEEGDKNTIPNIDALSQIIYQSPELKNLIMTNPEMVQSYVSKSPKLSKLFEGVNIFSLSENIKKQEEQKRIAEIPQAKDMSDDELYNYVEKKERLKDWMINNPEQLKEVIPQQKGLSRFFEGTDPDEVIRRYNEARRKNG